MRDPWTYALLLVPLAYGARWLDLPAWAQFAAAAAAIVPLAQWIRRATEQLAARLGSAIGGLLNVTFGSVAELTIALFVLAAGGGSVVKAQITGSIIGTGLLGLGLAILVGTWGRDNLKFHRERAGLLSSLLILASIALLLPALFNYTERGRDLARAGMLDEHLSLGVAGILIAVYVANLVYTLITHRDVFAFDEGEAPRNAWSIYRSLAVLLGGTGATALMAEIVASSLDGAAATLGVSTFFLGIVVLASVGNAAEYFAASYFARQGRMGLAMTLTVGSAIQVALLVAPVLVIASWFMGKPMNLVFESPLELIAIAGVGFAVNAIAQDGETTWFEGVLLIAVYGLLALAFYLLTPAG